LKKTVAVLFICAALGAGGCGKESPSPDSEEEARSSAEVSIRNETGDLVPFTVTWQGRREYPLDRVIADGEIERLPDEGGMVVVFRRGHDVVRRPVENGRTYTFRRNEEGELLLAEGWLGDEHPENLAPFLATPMDVVDGMLDLAGVTDGDLVCDLGSGDGRIPIRAAVRFGARGLGIEYNPSLVEEARRAAREAGVEDRVEFRLGDVLRADFSRATVVTIYLLSSSNDKLRPRLEDQLKRGTPVVTHDFPIPGWERKLVSTRVLEIDGRKRTLMLYRR